MITIAVDAMGGDNAPRPEVEGSVLAARELGVRVLLVGQQTVIRAELAKHAPANLPIEIVPASEVITMDDHPAQAFRRKKDSSVHVAARLVREAKAHGMVSAGNTGAVMTVARFLLGRSGRSRLRRLRRKYRAEDLRGAGGTAFWSVAEVDEGLVDHAVCGNAVTGRVSRIEEDD